MATPRRRDLLGAALFCRPPSAGGQPPSARIRATTRLVSIPVGVADRHGRMPEDLTAADFRLTDNGVAQTITRCLMEYGPREAVIVLDQSQSMGPQLVRTQEAARAYIAAAGSGDKVSVIAVRDSATVDVAPTHDPDQALRELNLAMPEGRTALFDGAYLGLNHLLKSGREHRVLLILSDGGDNSSRYSAAELAELAREAGAVIHSVVVAPGFPLSAESNGQETMKRLSAETGGWFLEASRAARIPDLVRRLHGPTHYVLAYSPEGVSVNDGRAHRVQVSLTRRRGLRLTWRRSYRAE